MKTKTKQRKIRLWSKKQPRLPKPIKGNSQQGSFPLRVIGECDLRFSVVKELHRRLKELMNDAGCDSIQKKMLAGRAVFLLAYLESCEVSAMEGERVDMSRYTSALNALTNCLTKLGIDKKTKRAVQSLEDYLDTDGDTKKKRKRKFSD